MQILLLALHFHIAIVCTMKLTYLSIFILVLWMVGFCVMALLCTRDCRFCDSRYFWGRIFKFKIFLSLQIHIHGTFFIWCPSDWGEGEHIVSSLLSFSTWNWREVTFLHVPYSAAVDLNVCLFPRCWLKFFFCLEFSGWEMGPGKYGVLKLHHCMHS
jgi:hypothetical protein